MIQGSLFTYADIPVPEKLIEIENFQVIRNDTLKVGDTLTILLDFSTKVNCEVALTIPISGGLTLLNDTTTNLTYRQTINSNRDSINYTTLSLAVSDIIPSLITGSVSIIPENEYFNTPIGFTTHDEAAVVVYPEPFNPNCTSINNYDETCKNFVFSKELYSAIHQGERRFINIIGSLLYFDHYAPHDKVLGPDIKGSLANVWLFFYKDGSDTLYHPVPFDNNGMPKEGVHFFRTGPDGAFSFNFSYELDSLVGTTMLANWNIALLVAKENEALLLHSNKNNVLVHGISNPDRSQTYIKFFTKLIPPEYHNQFSLEEPAFVWNVGNVFFSKIGSSDREGAIFRHTTLSRKFLIERLEIDEKNPLSMAINIPKQVEVVEEFETVISNGYLTSTKRIIVSSLSEQKRSDPTSNLLSHEWGHYYYHFIRNYSDFPTGDNQVVSEGWAVFFSDAMMNWAENKYGDRRSHIDDLEMGPYFSFYAELSPTEIEHNVRFGNVGKINYEADIARFACYLWNIYDSPTEGNFIRPQYEGYENDDVHGLGKDVFDCFKGYLAAYTPPDPKPTASGFNNYFQNYVASSDIELQNSIQRIYDFMRIGKGDELKDLYDNENDKINMIPPPVEIVESKVNLGIDSYVKVASTTYPDNIGIFAREFDDSELYPKVSYYAKFSNLEDGIFVEYFNFYGNIWVPLRAVSTDPDPDLYMTYLDAPQPTKYRLSTFKDIWDEGTNSTIRYFSNNAHPEFTVTFKNNINDEVLSDFSNLIYPNPSQDYLKIRSQALGNKDISINIYNINGDKCFESKKSSYNNELYITLPTILINGLYYIEIIDVKTSNILIKDSFIINK